jgi:hypothetical protein
LAPGFVRIRNFGFLANRKRATLLPLCLQLLGSAEKTTAWEASPSTNQIHSLWNCPVRGGTMRVVERLPAAQLLLRSPPQADRCADRVQPLTRPARPHSRYIALRGRLPSSRCIRSAPQSARELELSHVGAPDTALRLYRRNPMPPFRRCACHGGCSKSFENPLEEFRRVDCGLTVIKRNGQAICHSLHRRYAGSE